MVIYIRIMCFKFIDNAGVRFYRRRDSFSSTLWILLDKYYDQFESEYAERYEKVYGFLRPAIRYYGFYSNKTRGIRGKIVNSAEPEVEIIEEDVPGSKLARSRWAAMIQKVYEINPLKCPRCGNEMRIISFIEKRDQYDVIKSILKHYNLWREPKIRAPPKFTLYCEYIPMDEFLANF